MAWLTLSNDLFTIIMMEVGLNSLDDLHQCRQVCRKWNEQILGFVWDSKSGKRIMKERIERSWGPGMLPTHEEISHAMWLNDRGILSSNKIQEVRMRIRTVLRDGMITELEFKCGASLASHGLLGFMEHMWLHDVDLSSVPAKHMASLASSVTKSLFIVNVRGNLVSLLTGLKCQYLGIKRQSLGREETRDLVHAMESSVEEVGLCFEVTLDLESLAEYSGEGVCRGLYLSGDLVATCRLKLRTWARRRSWRVSVDDGAMLLRRD